MNHESTTSAKGLYDRSSFDWVRAGPMLLSDFTARPQVLELCKPVVGACVLDLGCGEGYCARKLMHRGARSVTGIDISDQMIQRAREQEQVEPLGIEYLVGNATDLSDIPDGQVDLVVCVFLFNYLRIDAMRKCMGEVARVLRPGGRFVFSVPHPLFPFLCKNDPPFYFRVDQTTYFAGRDVKLEGKLWRRDGSSVDVLLHHKTLQDYLDALAAAGFESMPTLRELSVTEDMVDIDKDFFAPLADIPLHVAISVRR